MLGRPPCIRRFGEIPIAGESGAGRGTPRIWNPKCQSKVCRMRVCATTYPGSPTRSGPCWARGGRVLGKWTAGIDVGAIIGRRPVTAPRADYRAVSRRRAADSISTAALSVRPRWTSVAHPGRTLADLSVLRRGVDCVAVPAQIRFLGDLESLETVVAQDRVDQSP